ncbi:hypothetical protein Q3G72_009568 [Acer saccharum]|nr:hypothetical protein Q3G72_009568 [Acer saccharum]
MRLLTAFRLPHVVAIFGRLWRFWQEEEDKVMSCCAFSRPLGLEGVVSFVDLPSACTRHSSIFEPGEDLKWKKDMI